MSEPRKWPWATIAAIATTVTLAGGFAIDVITERAAVMHRVSQLEKELAAHLEHPRYHSNLATVVAEIKPIARAASEHGVELRQLSKAVVKLGAAVEAQGRTLEHLTRRMLRRRPDKP